MLSLGAYCAQILKQKFEFIEISIEEENIEKGIEKEIEQIEGQENLGHEFLHDAKITSQILYFNSSIERTHVKNFTPPPE